MDEHIYEFRFIVHVADKTDQEIKDLFDSIFEVLQQRDLAPTGTFGELTEQEKADA